MLLDRTISQLDIGYVPKERAEQLAHLGYAQWLGALPGNAGYAQAAQQAYDRACPFRDSSPAIAIFCDMLIASIERPGRPLDILMPPRVRRGGARSRRRAF